MNKREEHIVGILFPVPAKLLPRIFEDGKDVFVKYLARSHVKLRPGRKIMFYSSGGAKQIVGEGSIDNIEFLAPANLLERYGDRLFITREELTDYTQSQPLRTNSKELFVAVLRKVRKYAVPVTHPGPITMAGMYITKDAYKQILEKTRHAKMTVAS